MVHSKEINACFRNHLISSSLTFSGHSFVSFFAHELPLKMRLIMAIRSRSFFAEILYNDNSNSNRDNKVDTIRIMHNSNSIGNSNIKEIVSTSSNPSINAIMRITSG